MKKNSLHTPDDFTETMTLLEQFKFRNELFQQQFNFEDEGNTLKSHLIEKFDAKLSLENFVFYLNRFR